jgi:hypothetical protein
LTARDHYPELVAELTERIGTLTTSEEWKRYLEFQSRFHHYRTGRSAIFQRFESLPSRRWTQRSVQC